MSSRFSSRYVFYLLRPLLHLFVLGFLFWSLYYVRLGTDLIPFVHVRIPVIVVSELIIFSWISMLLFVLIGLAKGLYDFRQNSQYAGIFFNVRWLRFIIIVFVAYLGSGFFFSGGISRWIVMMAGFFAFVFLSFADFLWIYMRRFCGVDENVNVLCVYRNGIQKGIVSDAFLKEGYDVTRLSADERNNGMNCDMYDVIVMVGNYANDQLQGAFDQVRLGHQDFYHVPTSGFLDDVVYEPRTIGSLHAFRLFPTKLDDRSVVFKRCLDIVGSICGIVLLSPVMLMVALAVILDSRGSVFYRQKRVGRQGRTFTFLKFRSMYTHLSTGDSYGGTVAAQLEKRLNDSDANTRDIILSKIENDPRVTRVGRFLRRTSLDELPQLFCVLWGTMSLVGPRPHLPREVAKYESRHTRLFAIKPGITGYAQIFGRDALSFDEEAKLDLDYIQNRSLWMDVYAIIRTVGVVFKGR